jgi:hypothetical protein
LQRQKCRREIRCITEKTFSEPLTSQICIIAPGAASLRFYAIKAARARLLNSACPRDQRRGVRAGPVYWTEEM